MKDACGRVCFLLAVLSLKGKVRGERKERKGESSPLCPAGIKAARFQRSLNSPVDYRENRVFIEITHLEYDFS